MRRRLRCACDGLLRSSDIEGMHREHACLVGGEAPPTFAACVARVLLALQKLTQRRVVGGRRCRTVAGVLTSAPTRRAPPGGQAATGAQEQCAIRRRAGRLCRAAAQRRGRVPAGPGGGAPQRHLGSIHQRVDGRAHAAVREQRGRGSSAGRGARHRASACWRDLGPGMSLLCGAYGTCEPCPLCQRYPESNTVA